MENKTSDVRTWLIPAFRSGQLESRVALLNKRVFRTGGPGLSVVRLGEERREVKSPDSGASYIEAFVRVAVGGAVPRVAGHSFVARVEHHGEAGNIVSFAPGVDASCVPSDVRTADPTCDHCKVARNRKDTFVLARPDGSVVRVGRNCLQDFLRSADVEVALRIWSLLSAIQSLLSAAEEEGYGGQSAERAYETVSFLACTVAAIRAGGWRSKAMAESNGGTPTVVTASWIAGPAPKDEDARSCWAKMQPVEADYEEAGEVVAWAESLDASTGSNDYLLNLKTSIAIGRVKRRHEGIVASGVAARRREVAKAQALAAGAALPGEHVGLVGQRYDLHGLTVKTTRPVSSDYGSSLLVTASGPDGNDMKFFHGGDPSAFTVGSVFHGKATVKKHTVWNGRNQTELTRCKWAPGPGSPGKNPARAKSAGGSAAPPAPEFDDDVVPF